MVQLREPSRTFRLVPEVPEQQPEGRLIGEAAKARGLSARQAAQQTGISDTRWRHIVAGYQPAGGSNYIQVLGPPETLARMAKVVGLRPEQLAEVGRADAAAELTKLLGDALRETFAHRDPVPDPAGSFPVGTGSDPLDLTDLTAEQIEAVKSVIRAMRARPQD